MPLNLTLTSCPTSHTSISRMEFLHVAMASSLWNLTTPYMYLYFLFCSRCCMANLTLNLPVYAIAEYVYGFLGHKLNRIHDDGIRVSSGNLLVISLRKESTDTANGRYRRPACRRSCAFSSRYRWSSSQTGRI